MRSRSPLYSIALSLFIVVAVHAEDRRPMREARSENGRFELQIRPGRPGGGESRRPRGVLLENREGRAGRRVWTERLVNDVAPREVAIHDDGRFVVTLDEFRRGGAAHAVVIYDQRGELLREFGLREILRGEDWKHVSVDRQAVIWLDGATWAFADEPPAFVTKLKWNREIRIDLQTFAISDDDARRATGEQATADGRQAPASAPSAEIPPEILALLEQPTSAPTGGAGGVETSEQAVQRALENLRRLAAASEVDVDIPGAANDSAAAGEPALEDATVEEPPAFQSDVPLPDPANPVDYMAWVMEQTETDGPSAVPFYEAACEAIVKWEGDPDLYDRALDGDPDALASPEIAAWLEANRDALANYRTAVGYDYRGWLNPSGDGSVIGILLPNLSNQRQLAKTAIVEARYLETQGDYASAFDIYADNFAAGVQVSQGPTLIENLVGIAMQGASADSVLDSLVEDRDDVDYAALAERLEEAYQPTRPVADTMDGERAMVFDVLQKMYAYDEDSGEYYIDTFQATRDLSMFGALMGGDAAADQLAIPFLLGACDFQTTVADTNRYYDKLVNGASEPYPQAMESLKQLEAEVSNPEFIMRNPLLGQALPALTRVVHLETRSEATRRATLLTANLKAYHQKYGYYPPSLDVFADREMAYDPFTGGQFAYQRDGDNFTLYSLGGNGVDDGGVHDRRAEDGDFVFWPRPAKE